VSQQANSAFIGAVLVENALYPKYQVHLLADYALPFFGLRVGVEMSVIGPRSASPANTLLKGEPYELPAYFYAAASVSMARRLLGERETSVALRLSNITNSHWSEPGFGGIDVPSQGFCAFLTLAQTL
jgi:hypothetical protein